MHVIPCVQRAQPLGSPIHCKPLVVILELERFCPPAKPLQGRALIAGHTPPQSD